MAHLVPASSQPPSLRTLTPQNDLSGQVTPTQESLTPTRPRTEATERKFERSASAPAPWSPSPPSPTPNGGVTASLPLAYTRTTHADTPTPVIHAHTSEKGTFSYSVPATPPYSPAHSRESTVSSFGNDVDPVSALRGRKTPFFMVTADEGGRGTGSGEDEDADSAWQDTRASWTRGEGIRVAQDMDASGRRGFKRGESAPALSFGQQGAAAPAGQAARPFAYIKKDSDFAHEVRYLDKSTLRTCEAHPLLRIGKVNVAQLASLVHALDARLSTLTGLSDDLYSRIVLLEDVTRQQGHELHLLRHVVGPQPVPYGPAPPVLPQSWSRGPGSALDLQPMPMVQPSPPSRLAGLSARGLNRTRSYPTGSFPLEFSGPRLSTTFEEVDGYGVPAFVPPQFGGQANTFDSPRAFRPHNSTDSEFFLQALEPQQDVGDVQPFQQDRSDGFAQHQDAAGAMGGVGLSHTAYAGGGRERSISFAEFGGGGISGKGEALSSRQVRCAPPSFWRTRWLILFSPNFEQGSMRARSISLGTGMQHRPSSSGAASFGNDPPNYRLLLENDADINAEVRQSCRSPYFRQC